jgi:hypothetical protein
MIFDQPTSEADLESQRRAAEAEAFKQAREHAEELKRTKTPPEPEEQVGSLFAGEREKTPKPIAPPSSEESVASRFFGFFKRG